MDDLTETGRLFRYFYTTLPLYECIKKFIHGTIQNKEQKESFFRKNEFYSDGSATKGLIYYRLAQYANAQQHLEKALELPEHICSLPIKTTLATIYYVFGECDKAVAQLQSVASLDELPSHSLIVLNMDFANAFVAQGKYDEAIEKYQAALDVHKQLYKDGITEILINILNYLGNALAGKSQYDLAIEKHEQALNMQRHIYKDEPHPNIADTLNNIGVTYGDKRQYDDAIRFYEKSLEMKQTIYKAEPHPDVVDTMNNLGNALVNKKEYNEAIKILEEALSMQKHIFESIPHPATASILSNLGEAYGGKKQYHDAIRFYKESLEMYEKIYKTEPNLDFAKVLNDFGGVLIAQDDYQLTNYELTVEVYEKALNMFREIYKGIPNAGVAYSLHNLGLAYSNFGRYLVTVSKYDQAVEKVQKALDTLRQLYEGEVVNLDEVYLLYNLSLSYKNDKQHTTEVRYCMQKAKDLINEHFSEHPTHHTLTLIGKSLEQLVEYEI